MATDYATSSANGGYGANGAEHGQSASYGATPSSTSTQPSSGDIPKEEVAWYFVEQYYTTLSRSPEKLYLFFNKRSQYVSGVEDEKVSVCIGQKAINERIKELGFQETKVRVTNVDSQTSDSTIVIQVIGEMSNKSQPHKKFVQTFVLASQTNGYFVLNDIFRFIRDEEEEEQPEPEQEQSAAVASETQQDTTVAPEPVPTEAPASEAVVDDRNVEKVDKELESIQQEQQAAGADTVETNGIHKDEVAHGAEDVPSTLDAAEEVKSSAPEDPLTLEPEKPVDPVPSPAPAAKPKPAAAAPAAPPKPVVPKTWAQLASGNRAAAAAAAAAAAGSSSSTSQVPAAQSKSTPSAPAPAPTAAAPVAMPTATSSAVPPAREPSPDSQKSGSQGGWQMAGDGHNRKQSRAPAPSAAQDNGRVRAYVKNVFAGVNTDDLKAHLSQFGELAYFDVSRAKNSAFVEFTTRAAFDAAVAANPHKINNENVFVEERRTPGGAFPRGGARGGRGGPYEGRAPGGRGGPFKADGPPGSGQRGGFTPRGGRGGAPRGRGGAPQAA